MSDAVLQSGITVYFLDDKGEGGASKVVILMIYQRVLCKERLDE